ncbi:MAG: hypothetical protein PVG15_08415 [Desulfobacterales bacterium]|jgi:hypothetical protein
MTDGLKERERLQQSLELAMEVQQNLLPGTAPDLEGLDIAGTNIYCEETGGQKKLFKRLSNKLTVSAFRWKERMMSLWWSLKLYRNYPKNTLK